MSRAARVPSPGRRGHPARLVLNPLGWRDGPATERGGRTALTPRPLPRPRREGWRHNDHSGPPHGRAPSASETTLPSAQCDSRLRDHLRLYPDLPRHHRAAAPGRSRRPRLRPRPVGNLGGRHRSARRQRPARKLRGFAPRGADRLGLRLPHRLGSHPLPVSRPQDRGRGGGSSLRPADRRRRHRPGLPVCPQRSRGRTARQARDRGRLYAGGASTSPWSSSACPSPYGRCSP